MQLMWFFYVTVYPILTSSDVLDPLGSIVSNMGKEIMKLDKLDSPEVSSAIDFENVDLMTEHNAMVLEAFKTKSREPVWFSIGYPTFIPYPKGEIYHFTPEHITAKIRLLSDEQKKALKIVAEGKQVEIKSATIHLLPLQKIVCDTKFFHENREYNINGEAYDLGKLEITLKLPYPENSEIRDMFKKRIQSADYLRWFCTFSAAGEDVFLTKVDVPKKYIESAVAQGGLFLDRNEVYVTRKQLKTLAYKIWTEMNKGGDLDADQRCDEKIFLKLLSMTKSNFKHVPLDEALSKLSPFGCESAYGHDIYVIRIKERLSETMVVKPLEKNEMIIVVNDTFYKEDEHLAELGIDFGTSDSDIGNSMDVVEKNQNEWKTGEHTLVQQLDALNWAMRDNIKWKQDGTKIVPESLNVALLDQSIIKEHIQIPYQKHFVKKPQYKKHVVVSVDIHVPAPDVIADIYKKMHDTCKIINYTAGSSSSS